MRRLDSGAPLRAAMKAAGLDITRLAVRTKEIDPEGKGISRSYVGHMVSTGSSGREECSDRAALLVATAVTKEVGELFTDNTPMSGESTSTRRARTIGRVKDLPDHLMTQRELAKFLRMSMSWIDKQIQTAQEDDRLWPGLIYIGGQRRFDPHEVLAAQRRQTAAA